MNGIADLVNSAVHSLFLKDKIPAGGQVRRESVARLWASSRTPREAAIQADKRMRLVGSTPRALAGGRAKRNPPRPQGTEAGAPDAGWMEVSWNHRDARRTRGTER